jgi:hypothetical protein
VVLGHNQYQEAMHLVVQVEIPLLVVVRHNHKQQSLVLLALLIVAAVEVVEVVGQVQVMVLLEVAVLVDIVKNLLHPHLLLTHTQ